MGQLILIAIILAACIAYAAFRFFMAWKKALKSKNYRCSGCAFYERCKSKEFTGQKCSKKQK